MEKSPLRYLDHDVALMLCDKVRESQENYAREYHSYNFENSHIVNLNRVHHYTLSGVYGYSPTMFSFNYITKIIDSTDTEKNIKIVKFIKNLYNEYLNNTKLQRCSY